jgi:hypothetical protein
MDDAMKEAETVLPPDENDKLKKELAAKMEKEYKRKTQEDLKKRIRKPPRRYSEKGGGTTKHPHRNSKTSKFNK